MSLAIDLDDVTAVLLADGWHGVLGQSFVVDAYEYVWRAEQHGPGGLGYSFDTDINGTLCTLAGPITAVLAVQQCHPESSARNIPSTS